MCVEDRVQDILETIRNASDLTDEEAAYIEAKLREHFNG